MTRRARRPSFDRIRLFGALAVARHQSILAGAAHGYGSPEHVLAHKIADAIDELAERLTGNKEYFWGQAHGSAAPPNTWEADRNM